jgi:hypothetical protein
MTFYTVNDIQEAVNFASKLAKENYDKRNEIINRFNDEYEANGEPRRCQYIKGECNYYLPITDGNGNKLEEITIECDVIPTVKNTYRYTYRLNGKRIARKDIIRTVLNSF